MRMMHLYKSNKYLSMISQTPRNGRKIKSRQVSFSLSIYIYGRKIKKTVKFLFLLSIYIYTYEPVSVKTGLNDIEMKIQITAL